MCMENYFFDTEEEVKDTRVYVLIIYDIIDNKRRLKLSKYLSGYGFRVQKSSFEAKLTKSKYEKMLSEIGRYADKTDSIRIYKIVGRGQVTVIGKDDEFEGDDEVIVI